MVIESKPRFNSLVQSEFCAPYLQAGFAVFLRPVNRDSLAARNSISRLVSSSVTARRVKGQQKYNDSSDFRVWQQMK